VPAITIETMEPRDTDDNASTDDGEDRGPLMVGGYVADYGPLPLSEELQTPEVDALIARSRVISSMKL